MSFTNTLFWKNYLDSASLDNNFGKDARFRCVTDAVMLYDFLSNHTVENCLQIGCKQGLTSLLVTDVDNKIKIIDIDIVDEINFYKNIVTNTHHKFIHSNSTHIDYSSIEKQDLIIVDGAKDADVLPVDLYNTIDLSHNKSTIILNYSDVPNDVLPVVRKILTGSNFVPVLQGHQLEIYRHVSIDNSPYLDGLFKSKISNFLYIDMSTVEDHQTVTIRGLRCINNCYDLADKILQFYEI